MRIRNILGGSLWGSKWERVLTEARGLWQEMQFREALALCDRASHMGQRARYEAALLRGDILRGLGDAAGALSSYESVAQPEVPDAQVDCARGLALFDLCRFAEAECALRSAIRAAPHLAEAHYVMGLLAEFRDVGGQSEHFRAARQLDPERFFPVRHWGNKQFESIVLNVLSDLDGGVRHRMEHVCLVVLDSPAVDDLKAVEPPMSPRSLGIVLGVMGEGEVALPAVAGQPSEGHPVQAVLLLFKKNLERQASSEDELKACIRGILERDDVAAQVSMSRTVS